MKFHINHPDFAGRTFAVLVDDDLTWTEADQVERVTGTTIEQIASDREVSGRAQVKAAFFWIAVRRDMPEVTYSDMLALRTGQIRIDADVPAPDPTPAGSAGPDPNPAGGTSEPGTSEPSPTTSASGPGNGTG